MMNITVQYVIEQKSTQFKRITLILHYRYHEIYTTNIL